MRSFGALAALSFFLAACDGEIAHPEPVSGLENPKTPVVEKPVVPEVERPTSLPLPKGFEVPELKLKLELASIKGETIGLNVFEREFVIMQAIVFPGINILWIGCVLMAMGTFMAVRQRLKRGAAQA